MVNPLMLAAETGLSARKTHRGSRGKKGKGSVSPHTIARQHHNALNAAMGSGDHAGAKKAALSLVKSLHAITGSSVPAIDEPDVADETSMTAQAPKAIPAAPSIAPTADPKAANRAKLAMTLMKGRTK